MWTMLPSTSNAWLVIGCSYCAVDGCCLSFAERFDAAHDVKNLARDGRLPRFVVVQLQGIRQVRCRIRRVTHGDHAGTVFAGDTFQNRLEDDEFRKLGHDLVQNSSAAWFVDVILDGAAGHLAHLHVILSAKCPSITGATRQHALNARL